MKKYIGAYGIQFIVLVVLHASKGLPLGWVFWEVDNRQNSIDGRQLTYTLLIINILIIQACLLMTIIVTVKSKIKFKWIILLCMFVYSFYYRLSVLYKLEELLAEFISIICHLYRV